MIRAVFVRKLQAIGDIEWPKGHVRRNKGVTTYFFPHDKIEEVARFVTASIEDVKVRYDHTMVPVSLAYQNPSGSKRVLLHLANTHISVAIMRWSGGARSGSVLQTGRQGPQPRPGV